MSSEHTGSQLRFVIVARHSGHSVPFLFTDLTLCARHLHMHASQKEWPHGSSVCDGGLVEQMGQGIVTAKTVSLSKEAHGSEEE